MGGFCRQQLPPHENDRTPVHLGGRAQNLGNAGEQAGSRRRKARYVRKHENDSEVRNLFRIRVHGEYGSRAEQACLS